MRNLFYSSFLVIILFTSIKAQGVIYSGEEADDLYGPVITTINIQSILLQKFINQTEQTLMFRISDGNLIILNSSRIQLYPIGFPVLSSDVFRVFSTNLIAQIIKDGASPVCQAELRSNEVISLTNGNYTLEFGGLCPPYCP